MNLPEVFGQLCCKIWLLLFHILQNSIVGVADFYTCGGDRKHVLHSENTNMLNLATVASLLMTTIHIFPTKTFAKEIMLPYY